MYSSVRKCAKRPEAKGVESGRDTVWWEEKQKKGGRARGRRRVSQSGATDEVYRTPPSSQTPPTFNRPPQSHSHSPASHSPLSNLLQTHHVGNFTVHPVINHPAPLNGNRVHFEPEEAVVTRNLPHLSRCPAPPRSARIAVPPYPYSQSLRCVLSGDDVCVCVCACVKEVCILEIY